MQTDAYTKFVLTIIAGALVLIAARDGIFSGANAQFGSCGTSRMTPCYIATGQLPLEVRGDR